MEKPQQLLTPDVTPPALILQPPRPPLYHDQSSRAGSFRTAREEQSREFLNAAENAGSQVGEDSQSEPNFSEDESNGRLDDMQWLDIPGAFRNTPSNASSRSGSKQDTQLDSTSTPSTGSSDKVARPKQYLDNESPPSTSSSHDIARPKSYHHDADSPSERQRGFGASWGTRSASCSTSGSSSGRDSRATGRSQPNGVKGHWLNAGERHEDEHPRDTSSDWGNHVSYMSADGDEDSEREYETAAVSTQGSSSSSRLSGHGRRVGNGTQADERPKRINNPAYSPSGTSNMVAEQGLLKRGSDDSSRLRSNGTPSPSVTAQRRRQKISDEPTPGAHETRRLDWLRQHGGTLASPDIPAEFLAAPPRDSNDQVYKQIQQANMDRFDALKNGSAVEAVVIPTESARNHHLRHVSKRQSLRSVSDNNSSYMPSSGPKRDISLRHKKAFSPQKSSLQGSPNSGGSGPHSLRHEKRPLSGAGRPLQSNDGSPVLTHSKESPTGSAKPPRPAREPQKLRHSSLPMHFGDNPSATTLQSTKSERSRSHRLRRSSREYRLENKPPSIEQEVEQRPEQRSENKDTSTIVETMTFNSLHFLGLNNHNRNKSVGTPLSTSAVSDRTEMEVCEAQNVAFYPHSNDSLRLVQQGPNPASQGKAGSSAPKESESANSHDAQVARLFSQTPPQEPPNIAVNGKSIHTVDSPLTNPRQAPMPPAIQFIPPTPSHDDERELSAIEEEEAPSTPQRRASLVKRARRYSDVVVRPLFGRTLVTRSHNIHPSPTMSEKRDEKLHPNWVPNSFWQDEDDDEFSDPDDSFEPLPPGGDTSEHPRARFPRNMSVRMPGFRGSGGFLLGNSLGMDRHGTNKRRHYVAPPRNNSSPGANVAVRRAASLDSVTTRSTADGRIFVIPGTRTRLQYVGFKPLKDKMRKHRESREDAAREKRRAEIKDQIGMRIVHDA